MNSITIITLVFAVVVVLTVEGQIKGKLSAKKVSHAPAPESSLQRRSIMPHVSHVSALFEEDRKRNVSKTKQCVNAYKYGVALPLSCTAIKINTVLLQSLKKGSVVKFLKDLDFTMEVESISPSSRSILYSFKLSTGGDSFIFIGKPPYTDIQPYLHGQFRPFTRTVDYVIEPCGKKDCNVMYKRPWDYFHNMKDK